MYILNILKFYVRYLHTILLYFFKLLQIHIILYYVFILITSNKNLKFKIMFDSNFKNSNIYYITIIMMMILGKIII
jgi:hypothetical protein